MGPIALLAKRWHSRVYGGVVSGGPYDFGLSPLPLGPTWVFELGWTGLGLGLGVLGTKGLGIGLEKKGKDG